MIEGEPSPPSLGVVALLIESVKRDVWRELLTGADGATCKPPRKLQEPEPGVYASEQLRSQLRVYLFHSETSVLLGTIWWFLCVSLRKKVSACGTPFHPWWRVARRGSRLGKGMRFETPIPPLPVFRM